MQINGQEYRSVWFENSRVKMIDQNKLPFAFEIREYSSYIEVAAAIREMIVRGAPAIGASGAYGLALAALSAPQDKFRAYLRSARDELISTRPTAVDLSIGVNYVYENTLKFIPDLDHARQVVHRRMAVVAQRQVVQGDGLRRRHHAPPPCSAQRHSNSSTALNTAATPRRQPAPRSSSGGRLDSGGGGVMGGNRKAAIKCN